MAAFHPPMLFRSWAEGVLSPAARRTVQIRVKLLYSGSFALPWRLIIMTARQRNRKVIYERGQAFHVRLNALC